MRKYGNELIFISQINRDGSGTTPVSEKYLKILSTDDNRFREHFKMHRLSLSEDTYIAHGFNAFVVKLKQTVNERL